MTKFGNGRGVGFCVLFLVVGAVIGGVLGELLRSVEALEGLMPYLVSTCPILEIAPFTVNLYVLKLTLGLSFTPNLMSIFGVLIAMFLFKKY